MRKIALSGAMFGDDILRHLTVAGETGYKGIELRGMGPLLNGEANESFIVQIENSLKEGGLEVPTFSTWLGGYALKENDHEREKELERSQRFFALSERLKCPWVRVNPSRIPPAQSKKEQWETECKWMGKVADSAKEYGVGIYIEMHHGTLCDTKEHTQKYLDLISRENVGIILDPYNLYQVPTDCNRDTIQDLCKYIVNVHVKDLVALTDASYPYCFEYESFADHAGRFVTIIRENEPRKKRYFANRMVGQGGVDWYCIISALKDTGYKGFLTIEATNGNDPNLPEGRELAVQCYIAIHKILDQVGY
jgi:sugar phosphate isomerase/epimerase